MFFEIDNIGKIKNAQIEMQGITVLAGNNSTGKSTFGKALYCIFNAFYESDSEIKKERKRNIEDIFIRYRRYPYLRLKQKHILDVIVDMASNAVTDLPKEIKIIIQDAIEQNIIRLDEADDVLDELAKKIASYTEISNEQYQKAILERYLAAEFDGQITHINMPQQPGKISLSFKNGQVHLTTEVDKNECVGYTDEVGIVNRAFYVDTPFVMDFTSQPGIRSLYGEYNHRHRISEHLISTGSRNISEDVIGKERLKSVLASINLAVSGDFSPMESGGLRDFGFRENGLNFPLELTNVSAGMKVFLIIKRLLEKGEIKERDVLILDEPEIHLHPEWQIIFAETLVLLQKEFELTILLTTHSPYFLHAIEVYSEKQGISDRCRYYLTTTKDGYCCVQDTTKDTDCIYQILAKPFQTLDNTRYAE